MLLALLPALMAWFGRYRQFIKGNYQVMGGKLLLSMVIACAFIIILQAILVNII
ncbi:aromatic amino acid transport family protein [Rickettsiella grylli]|uniref:aromatic amino acid transport family protein n=1 Tax=Rickettsiella grylli TaxID=59196 RepID=UPI000ACF1D15|nr:aromatic amino acid transport family protein [Rickettsiella grylli]